MVRHNKSKDIIPSAMDEGCEIHTEEYAKLHTKIAFDCGNSARFSELSKLAESRTMQQLEYDIDVLVELLDARKQTTRIIAYNPSSEV